MPARQGKSSSKPLGLRVLVIDDSMDATLLLSMLLKGRGYDVHTRNSGQAGLEAGASLNPEVILLDIGMPEMDGFETCELLRQQPWGQSVVVIALTGYGQEEDKRRAKEAGFDAHLVKPVTATMLTQLIDELVTSKQVPPGNEQRTA